MDHDPIGEPRPLTSKYEWIGKQMKELDEGAEIIDFEEARQALSAEPPEDGGWLERLTLGTTFFTTKKNMINEPELLRVMLIGRTGPVSHLMLIDVPGGTAKIFLDVHTKIYSDKYILIGTI